MINTIVLVYLLIYQCIKIIRWKRYIICTRKIKNLPIKYSVYYVISNIIFWVYINLKYFMNKSSLIVYIILYISGAIVIIIYFYYLKFFEDKNILNIKILVHVEAVISIAILLFIGFYR